MNRAISGCTRLLKGLSLRMPEAAATEVKVAPKKYVFPANDRKLESLVIETSPTADSTTLVFRIDGTEQRIVCGRRALAKGQDRLGLLAGAAGSGERCLDGRRFVHREALFL